VPEPTAVQTPAAIPDIVIPAGMLPGDGRFGSGPSKVRPDQVAALASVAVALANLVVDILYAFIDPRVRYA